MPIEYATVEVYADTTSHPINGAVSDSLGRFEIAGLPAGTYRIVTSFAGYEPDTFRAAISKASLTVTDTIRLVAVSSQSLNDVVVTAQTPTVENRIDKIVFNVENDVTAQGSTTLDILRKVPQVTVDIDGTVELQGNSNIRFLINGKPSSIFGASLSDALAAIPAGQIKRIEAITTPGARYDAQGTGGIINIILKDSRLRGYNGSLSLAAGSRLSNGAANFTLREGKLGVTAYASGNGQLTSRTPFLQRRSSTGNPSGGGSKLNQDGYNDVRRFGYQAGISLEYELPRSQNLSAGLSYNHYNSTSRGQLSQQLIGLDAAGTVLSDFVTQRSSTNVSTNSSLDWNLSYSRKFRKEGQVLELGYNESYGTPLMAFSQSQYLTTGSQPLVGSVGRNEGSDLQSYFTLDYTHPITETFSIESGAKLSLQHIRSTTAVNAFDPLLSEYLADAGQSYDFKYSMAVYAGYASAAFSVWNYLDVKAGLRYEYTGVGIDYPGYVVPSYGVLSPTLIVSHRWNGNQTIKFTYTRRIERAEYDELNPFVNRSDPYNLVTGNPLLKPELGNNLELGYGKSYSSGASLNVSLIERINTQDHKRVVAFFPAFPVGDSVFQNVSVQRNENAGTEFNSGVNVSGSATVLKKLSLRGNAMFFTTYFAPSLSVLGTRAQVVGHRFRLNANATYSLTDRFVAEAFGNYSAPSSNIQGRTPAWLTYTMAVRLLLLNRKLSLGLNATNPFSPYVRQVSTIKTENYSSYVERQIPFRSVGISASWRFGKLETHRHADDDRSYLANPPDAGN